MTLRRGSRNDNGGGFIRRHILKAQNRLNHFPPDPAYIIDRQRLAACLENLESFSGE
jgi:hypothetical protein